MAPASIDSASDPSSARRRSETLSSLRNTSVDGIAGFPSSTMADLATSASSASAIGQHASNHHQRQKRARSQLSCTPCRQGKLKCNRQHDPACDQCIKRNRESACVYVPPPVRHKPVQNVKGRIRQLENLVVDLMNQNQEAQRRESVATAAVADSKKKKRSDSGSNGEAPAQQNGAHFSQPTPPSDTDHSPELGRPSLRKTRSPSSDIDSTTKPFGQMRISKDEIRYVGEAHWGAILNSISDLKRDLDDEDDGDELDDDESPPPPGQLPRPHDGVFLSELPRSTDNGIGFIVGSAPPLSKEQLIKSMPDKKVVDRLLSLWFNSPDPFKPIVHAPTFQEEYLQFWRTPQNTPAMWLGLLFSIMSLAASFGLRDVDPTSTQAQQVLAETAKYHSCAASAAVLADFTKPGQYTLECLILYAAGLRSNNAFVDVWLMIGLVVRLALRMGYHRDPDHYPNITPFEGEMRRRCWAIINMIDVLISFQLGLPSMVKTIQSDSEPPRNLLDRDFNPNTKELPPSRKLDELTPSSYTRAKLKIILVFAEATELSHATIPPSYEQILALDRKLEEAKAAIPPLLRMPDISELVTDPAEQLMCRFNLDLLYLKTKLVLHRKHMLTPYDQLSPAEQEQGIGDSRKACTESALCVLQHHHTIYTASQTGGQLESVKWYMGSISTHDFLLAAMIICLELSCQIKDPSWGRHPWTGLQCSKRRELMEALDKSHHIWSSASQRKRQTMTFAGSADPSPDEMYEGATPMFDETERASRAMGVMVEKVKQQFGLHAGETPQTGSEDCGLPVMQAAAADAADDIPVSPRTTTATDSGAPMFYIPEQANRQPNFLSALANYDWGNLEGIEGVDPSRFSHDMLGHEHFPQHSGGTVISGAPASNSMPFDSSDHMRTSSPRHDVGNIHQDRQQHQQLQQQQQLSRQQQQQQQQQPTQPSSAAYTPQDFSMTSEMLDVPGFNFDWRVWDQEIISNPQISGAVGGVSEPSSLGPSTHHSPFNHNTLGANSSTSNPVVADGLLEVPSRYGNTVAGGTGPGAGIPNVFAPHTMDFRDVEMDENSAGGVGFWYGE